MRAPHTYFSTEFHGGTRALRARLSNLFAAPRRRGRLPLLGLVLLVGALGGLVACHGGSSATIAMDTQYYDDRGSILEIPQITGDRSEAAQAINAALLARKAVYQTYVDDPYRDASWCEVTAWPTTTDRYLNLALVENVYPTYGSDGTLFSWVYDKKDRREVTREQALELAGRTCGRPWRCCWRTESSPCRWIRTPLRSGASASMPTGRSPSISEERTGTVRRAWTPGMASTSGAAGLRPE